MAAGWHRHRGARACSCLGAAGGAGVHRPSPCGLRQPEPGPPGPVAARADPAARAVDRLRPDRQDRARPLRPGQPRGRDVRPDPADPGRRDDRGRGPHLLGQRGLRHGSGSSPPASTRSAAGPAAPRRSPSSSSASGCSRADQAAQTQLSADRKIKEIIQSIRVTQAFPGVAGQAADHGGLPQPELLRQRLVRGRRGGAGLLRRRAQGPDARPGGDPGRDPPVAVDLRPGPERDVPQCTDPGPGRRPPAPRHASWSSRPTPPSSSVATWCWT